MFALYCIFSVKGFRLSIGLNNKISLLKKKIIIITFVLLVGHPSS